MNKRHDFERNFAIIIGINEYEVKNTPLKLAVPDAELMKDILSSPERGEDEVYKVLLLKDKDATQEKISNLLENLKKGKIKIDSSGETIDLKEEHRLLFYFSGHGYASIRETSQPHENEQYLLCQDGNKLPMQELTNTLGQLPCRHKLLILDCCYSGAIRRTSTTEIPGYKTASLDDDGMSFRADYDRMWKNPTFTVITSAGYELALDSDNKQQKNSYFAIALSNAIKCSPNAINVGSRNADLNKDGIITAQEICTYIHHSHQVISRQLPQIYSLTSSDKTPGGQYIFLFPDFKPDDLKKIEGLSNPYKGLFSYEQEDAPIFCGRKRFIDKLFELVSKNNQKLTVVTGASGSGKSSLVKAGLIPKLDKKQWLSCEFRPGNSPFSALFKTLEESSLIEQHNNSLDKRIEDFNKKMREKFIKIINREKLIEFLQNKKIQWEFEELYKELIKSIKVPNNKNILIVIDQFEELITLCQSHEKELFLNFLSQILDQLDNFRLVLTVRSDFEIHFQDSLNSSNQSKKNKIFKIAQSWNNKEVRLYIEDMNSHELKQVIERPAALFHVDFESDKLVSQIIEQVRGMPGALPLLSFTLDELYQRAKDTRSEKITQNYYDELGGVVKALTKRANEEYEKLAKIEDNEDQSAGQLRQEMMKFLMLRMTSLQGGQAAKRPVLLSELEYPTWRSRHRDATEQMKKVRQQLENEKSRLIVTGAKYTEPAHDALILHWDKLQEWIEQEKDNLVLHNRLIIAVEDWQEREHQKQKNPIVLVLNPVGYALGCVTEQLMRFGFWSFQLRNRILQWLNPLTWLGYIKSKINPQTSAVPTSAAEKLGGHLWHNDPRLEQLRELLYTKNSWLNATETEFVRRSVIWKGTWNFIWSSIWWIVFFIIVAITINAKNQEEEAKLKSVEALRESAEANLGSNRQLEAALDILKAQKTLNYINPIWGEIPPKVRSSVQGTFFKLLYGTQERNRLQLDRGSLYEVVFNPNPNPQQEQLATVGEGDTVRLWNSEGDELAPLITEQKAVYSVAFRYDPKEPDSTVLATAGADGKVKFWDIQPDGSSTSCAIDSANKDNSHCSIKPIDLAKGNKEIDIDDVEFSADGTLLAIIEHNLKSRDYHVKLWKVVKQEGEKINAYTLEEQKDFPSTLLGQENVSSDIAFMPQEIKIQGKNYNVLATVGKNDVVKLWNITSGEYLGEINTQQGYVYSVAFKKDGILMTGGADGTVKRWRIEPQDNKQSNPNQQVKFTPDALNPIETKQENVYAVAVSPKDKLATVGEDDVVKLWNNNGEPIHDKIQPLEGSLSDSKTRSVAFRPDGERLATIGGDNTIRLWDISGRRIRRFGDVPEQMENVVFSPDGKLLATVGTIRANNAQDKEKNILRLWDAGTGEEIDFVVSPFNFKSLVFLPDPPKKQSLPGQPIAAIKDDGTVYILFIDPKEKFRFAKKNGTLNVLEAGKFDQDYLSKNKIERLTFSANFTYKGIIYTPTPNEKDKSKQLIQLRRSGNNRPVELRLENPGSIALSADGQRFAIARTDGVVQVWNTDKLFANTNINTFPDKPDIELQTQQGNITDLAFYPADSDRLVTGGADGTVRLWDLSRNKPTQLPLLRDGELKTATASADGNRLATLSKEGILNLWDVKDGTLKANPSSVEQLNQRQKTLEKAEKITLSSTGKYIAIIRKDGIVLLWNTENDIFAGVISTSPNNPNNKVRSIEFAPDNSQLVATRESGGIEVLKLGEDGHYGQWSQDLDEQANQSSYLPNTNQDILSDEQDIVSASFSQKTSLDLTTLDAGRTILATLGKDGTVKLWNAEGRRIETFKTDQKKPNVIAFSPDGIRLATGAAEDDKTEGTVRVWDTKGRRIRQFGVGLGDVKSVIFSNDAQKLAIVAKKETSKENSNNQENFRVFDVNDDSREHINPRNTQQGLVENAIFTSDGHLTTLSTNGRLSLWQMSDLKLREGVCQLVWDYLNSNPTVKQDIGDLCGNVDEPMEQRFSAGEKLLIHSNPSPEKLVGIKAFANGDLDTAISNLDISLAPKRKDPEALIYLNNALIRNRKSYTIAVSVPISSDTDGALEILRGVAQAQSQINQTEEGINGAKLRILIADDKNDPKVAKQIAKELVKKPDVLGVVGHFTSDVTLAASEIYNAEKLAAISPASTSVKLSNKGQYTFRTVPSDKEAARELAEYMVDKFPQKNAVVFYNSESEYSNSLKNEFVNSERGRVLKEFDLSDSSFDAVESVTDVPEETILVLMPNTELLDKALEVVQENAKRKKPLPLLAGDDVYSPKTLKENKADAVDMVVAVPWHILPNLRKEFVQTSQWLWGGDVNWRTAMSYDATLALIEGLKQNPSREGVAQALRETGFTADGATDKVQFSASGDRREPKIQLVKIEPGNRSSFGYDFVPVP